MPSALFAIRIMKQKTTKFTPFELTYSRKAKQPVDQIIEETLPKEPLEERLSHHITTEIQELHKIRNKAAEFIAVVQDRQKKNYDSANKEVTRLAIGDKVLLYRNIVESSWSAKLKLKWDKLYHIASIKNTIYKLRKMTGILLLFTVH